jgi:hypothetical protein
MENVFMVFQKYSESSKFAERGYQEIGERAAIL